MPWLLLAVSGSSVDLASGKLEHRPALDAMLAQLRPGDMVTVWSWTAWAGPCGT